MWRSGLFTREMEKDMTTKHDVPHLIGRRVPVFVEIDGDAFLPLADAIRNPTMRPKALRSLRQELTGLNERRELLLWLIQLLEHPRSHEAQALLRTLPPCRSPDKER